MVDPHARAPSCDALLVPSDGMGAANRACFAYPSKKLMLDTRSEQTRPPELAHS